jgi:hypothetical protein
MHIFSEESIQLIQLNFVKDFSKKIYINPQNRAEQNLIDLSKKPQQ